MSTTEADTTTIDGPTLWAAGVTLLFAVCAGIALSGVPQDGNIGGALDALKNLVYVLTVPLFDLSRRLLARRKVRAAAARPPIETPNLLRLAFVTALVLFVLIELLGWLTGFGMGHVCVTISQTAPDVEFGKCLALGITVLATVLFGPVMIALGITAGWIWKGTLHSGFWITLLFFMLAVAVLFSLDFFILLQQEAGAAQALKDQFNAVGPVRQIGLQVVLLSGGVLLGYGARRLWHAVAGVFG